MAHGPTNLTNTVLDDLRVGDTVRTILRHCSRSGMTRHISLVIPRADGLMDLTYAASRVLDMRVMDDGGLKVGGTGMDMGFHVVYGLAHTLWPNGHRCTGRNTEGRTIHRCPSNDHTNDYGQLSRQYDHEHPAADRYSDTYVHARQTWIAAQETYRKSRRHTDGGYALNQRWI